MIDWEDYPDLEEIIDADELIEGTSITEDDIIAIAETEYNHGVYGECDTLIEYMFSSCEPRYNYHINEYEVKHIWELCREYVVKNYGFEW